ncbi:MAG: hypothetical protein K8T20_11850 [Planctomycetes bacterium]|nr:hypothetical protein [Planctomycetota bacterium]
MNTNDRVMIAVRETKLGVILPPQIVNAWVEDTKRLSVFIGSEPESILLFSEADEMTPLGVLPIARLGGFSRIGIYFDDSGNSIAMCAQDYESMSLDLVTTQFAKFCDSPGSFVEDSVDRLVSPDQSIDYLEEKLMPGFDDEWNEMSVFRPFWLAIEEFADESEETFNSIVSGYGKRKGAAEIVRSSFPKPEGFADPDRWYYCFDALEKSGNELFALKAMDNLRALFLAGLDDEYAEAWPRYWEDTASYWKILDREAALAARIDRRFDLALLRAIIKNRSDE